MELLGSFPSEVVFRNAHKIIFPNAPVALEPKKSAHSQQLIPPYPNSVPVLAYLCCYDVTRYTAALVLRTK